MKRVVLLIVAAVLLASAAGMATFWFASRAEERALVGFEFVGVYSTLAEIPANTTLGQAVADGLAGPTDVAERFVPDNALTEITAENSSLITPVTLAEGQLLLNGDFVVPPDAPVLLVVPDGMVAVSVALSDPQRVGAFLQPGSPIAILHTGQNPDANGAVTTRTEVLFNRVDVLAVGEVSDDSVVSLNVSVGEGTPSTLVTVALEPGQVTRLVHGISTGTLYLALLSDGTAVPYGVPQSTVTGR
jgi:pilus assembly protein CpaB